jgi:pimeloyl-ACP methyl ester carboxylesterase
VVHTGHGVQEEKPEVVIDAILNVVREARSKQN